MIFIVVVKKTFRYSNVYFYNHLCCTSVFRNIIMENGIMTQSRMEQVNKASNFSTLLSSLQPIAIFLLIAAGVAWYLTVL